MSTYITPGPSPDFPGKVYVTSGPAAADWYTRQLQHERSVAQQQEAERERERAEAVERSASIWDAIRDASRG